MDSEYLEQTVQQSNKSDTSSKYYTPNESFRNDQSRDRSDDSMDKITHMFSAFRLNSTGFVTSHESLTNTCASVKIEGMSSFVESAEQVEEKFLEPIIISEDEDESDGCCGLLNMNSSKHIIEILDNSEEYMKEVKDLYSDSMKEHDDSFIEVLPDDSYQINNDVDGSVLDVPAIDNIFKNNYHISEDEGIVCKLICEGVSEIYDQEIHPFSVSSNTNTQHEQPEIELRFNDTSEEMEMALKYGFDYVFPESGDMHKIYNPVPTVAQKNTIQNVLQKSKVRQFSDTSISSDYGSSKCTLDFSVDSNHSQDVFKHPETINKRNDKKLTPFKTKNTKYDNILSPVAVYINQKLPAVQKCILKGLKKPVNYPVTNYDSAPSPVALYIKNTPSAPLIQNVPSKKLSKIPMMKKEHNLASDKENMHQNLPPCLYKPAAYSQTFNEDKSQVPKFVQKLVPNTPEIIRHKHRTAQYNKVFSTVTSQLSEADLTIAQANIDRSSDTTASEDMSFFISKKAFIK